eukprot:TRINITY_DN20180_c0_g1_i2.p1 TRINITY_DN20180_c0_g1~~TRINITY_DN20180_c0_g1_i2.p1  ORF type:complete len:286 (-),score=59.60 TRINITY_DN20180_c0_g1_i2:25-882(-)
MYIGCRGDDLATLLGCLMRYLRREELVAVRSLCTRSPPFASVAVTNVDAAVLAIHCANRELRQRFNQVERRLCHSSACWRRGFWHRSDGAGEASFWVCRGICLRLGRQLPSEIRLVVASFCDNPRLRFGALEARELSRLHSLGFHWHRCFSQGVSGPRRAVELAWRTLDGAGAETVRRVGCALRRGEWLLDDTGRRDVSAQAVADAQVLEGAIATLEAASAYLAAHPLRFGRAPGEAAAAAALALAEARDEDLALKEEQRGEEDRLKRWRELGYFPDDAQLDARA